MQLREGLSWSYLPREEHPHGQYTLLTILPAPARGPSLALVFAKIGNVMEKKGGR